jgi:heptosyltransferase-2
VSRVFVSNDSGAMHMASALGVPVVALFGPTREYETAPIARHGRRADVLLHPVWCRPVYAARVPDRSSMHEGVDAGACVRDGE